MLLPNTVEDDINRFPKTRNREIRSVQMEMDAVRRSGIRRRLKGARDKVLYPSNSIRSYSRYTAFGRAKLPGGL